MWQRKPCPPIHACSFTNVLDAGKYCGRLPAIAAFSALTARFPVRQSRRPRRAAAMPAAVDKLPFDAGAYVLLIHLDIQLPL
jgi:hypothetical protein